MITDAHADRPPRRYALLALALVVPSLGLAGLASAALRAERRAAEADLRVQAERMAWNVVGAVTNAWTAGWDARGDVHELKLGPEGTLAWPKAGVWPPVPVEVTRGMPELVRTVWRRAQDALARGDGPGALEALGFAEVRGQGDEWPPGGTPGSTAGGTPAATHSDLPRGRVLGESGVVEAQGQADAGPPGRMPGSTAGGTPAATHSDLPRGGVLGESGVVEARGQADAGPPGGTPGSTAGGTPAATHLDLLRGQALGAVGEVAAAAEAFRRVLVECPPGARTESGLSVREVALASLVGGLEDGGGSIPEAWRTNTAQAVREVADVSSTPVSEAALTRLRVWLGEKVRTGELEGEWEKVEAPLRRRDWARRSYEAIPAKQSGWAGDRPPPAAMAWHLDRQFWIAIRAQDSAAVPGSGSGPGSEGEEPGVRYRARRWADVVDEVRGTWRHEARSGVFGFSVDLQGPGFSVHSEEPSEVAARALTTVAASGPGELLVTAAVALVDRDTAFAGQRRRERLLGGIVLAGVAISVLASGLTWRVLVRQHRLGVQKSNFVASVSHELRAPLASVRLLADNLEQERVTEAGRRQATLRLIGRECRRLGTLVDNVLDLSRIERGRRRIEPEPADVLALVREAVGWAGAGADERGVEVRFEPGSVPEGWVATVDGAALQQVLANLLDNAVKHAPRGTVVSVGLDVGPEGFRLSVADAGPGIPEAERKRVFEPFHRLGTEMRREQPGVGIGLAIVKHLVEAHGGRVWVEAAEPTGARFVVSLPT